MSITSEELNYLIWRYFQESGNEISALALQDETRVLDFDDKYKKNVPLGTLVNLVQKGILYSECELLVQCNGEIKQVDDKHFTQDFNLAQALQVSKEKGPEILMEGRFALENEANEESTGKRPYGNDEQGNQNFDKVEAHDSFIKTLKEVHKLSRVVTLSWHPQLSNVLAFGEKDSIAKIVKFEEETFSITESFELKHPFAPKTSTGKLTNEVTNVAWSPNGKEIVTGVENGELRLWSSEGKLHNVFNFHQSPIVSIKWNKDSTHFITADVDNVTIVWNAITGTAVQHFELKSQETSTDSFGVDLEWVESDKFIIPGPKGSLVVYQMGENKPIGRLLGHEGPISVLQFNMSNKMLLSASDDHTVRVWRGGSSNPSNCFFGHSQSIISASWLDDDKVISASMDGSVRLWSLNDNSLLAISMADGVPIFSANLSKDKKKYAVGFMDGQITIYDVNSVLSSLNSRKTSSSPTNIPVYGGYQSPKDGDCIFDISWSRDNDMVAVAYSIGEGRVISM